MAITDWQMYPTTMAPGRRNVLCGVELPIVTHRWRIEWWEEFYQLRTVWGATYNGHTIGPCETPEALAVALALIDPTLED